MFHEFVRVILADFETFFQRVKIPSMQKRNIFLGGAIAGIVFFDVVSKYLVQKFLFTPVEVLPILKLELTKNPNLAFGIPFPRVLTILLSVLAIIFFGNLFVKNVKKNSKIGLAAFGLILGGAIGNLGERIFFGQVTDFIALLTIPNFNLADTALTIGVILLIIFHSKIFTKV
jgi:signal peptidase II